MNIKSLKFFDYEITNIVLLSSNRIILGLYNSEKNESIIREHILRIEDIKNNIERFDCIGQGILESKKIDNIIKINEAQILINIKNDFLLIYEKTNEISEKLKESLNVINNKNKQLIPNNDIKKLKTSNIHFSILKTERNIQNHKTDREYLLTNNNPNIPNKNLNNTKIYNKHSRPNSCQINYITNSTEVSQLTNLINNNNKNNYKPRESIQDKNLYDLLPRAYKGNLDNKTGKKNTSYRAKTQPKSCYNSEITNI